MATLVIFRHGQSVWNLENKFTGWVDVELTEKGVQEAKNAGEKLKPFQFDLAYASDLNPVAVLINKAMIEIPPKFADRPPVGPLLPDKRGERFDLPVEWPGATGLAEDLRRYGAWMRAEAQRRIGHLYPKVEVTQEMATDRPDLLPYLGQKLTVIAWLWARTVEYQR